MPTLEFKGKQHIFAHHLTVPLCQIVPVPSKSYPPLSSFENKRKFLLDENLIIHGDNLHALKALLPHFGGRVNCIYIDPPYNTGNEGWAFNDNVNSPLMREWFKQQSPVDGEDLERHDKWLCMMWPRVHLLKELLAEDGTIFVSIDDHEQHRLRMLLDEVFGIENFIASIIWKKRSGAPNDQRIGAEHEYILVYGRSSRSDPNLNLRKRSEKQLSRYKNPDNHPKGPWAPDNLMSNVKGGRYVESLHFGVTNPKTGKTHFPSSQGNWRFNQAEVARLLENNEIYFGKNSKGRPKLKRFLQDVKAGVPFGTLWDEVPLGRRGSKEIQILLGDINAFDNPKPEGLIREILHLATKKDSIVLDSFAGSGTTAQAVLSLNKEDKGRRKFILVECEEYADNITAERVRKAIVGVPNFSDEELQVGRKGTFTFCELGSAIDLESLLKGTSLPTFASLAAVLLFRATGISASETGAAQKDEIGLFFEHENIDYYLLYQPSLGFLRSDRAVFNSSLAKHIEARIQPEGRKALVFAAAKYISQRELTRMGITFCQIPYELHVVGE